MENKGLTQHQRYARTGKVDFNEQFGVDSLEKVSKGKSMGGREIDNKVLSDENRGKGTHVPRGKGMMPGERHPDHGDHKY